MIRRVLVYAYGDRSHEHAMTAAAIFAKHNEAELMGLFVKPDFVNYSTVYGTYPVNLAQAFFDTQKEYAAAAQATFEKIAKSVGCRTQWHVVDQYEKKPTPTAYTDFIFVSQPKRDTNVIFSDLDFIDHAITSTGLPTLIIPDSWAADSFARKPILAWKESREAISAVRFALPLMRSADDLNIVTVTDRGNSDEELVQGIEISEYLTEHEVRSKFFCEHMNDDEARESQTLIRHAQEHQRDLIIAGGYSHSRFREVIMGGVTRELIKSSPIPLLLAH